MVITAQEKPVAQMSEMAVKMDRVHGFKVPILGVSDRISD